MRVRVSGRSHASLLYNGRDLYLSRKADCCVSARDLHKSIFTILFWNPPVLLYVYSYFDYSWRAIEPEILQTKGNRPVSGEGWRDKGTR